MSGDFQKVAVLGGGLLGGSLALALASRADGPAVSLWSRREETTRQARECGIASATSDLAEALAGADLVVLAVPVGAMPALIDQSLAAGLSPDALVTDVGSVKSMVHRTLFPKLSPHGIAFIGSHPMAGSERSGPLAATSGVRRAGRGGWCWGRRRFR